MAKANYKLLRGAQSILLPCFNIRIPFLAVIPGIPQCIDGDLIGQAYTSLMKG